MKIFRILILPFYILLIIFVLLMFLFNAILSQVSKGLTEACQELDDFFWSVTNKIYPKNSDI